MMQFKAFKPSGMEKIARSMGYQGDMGGFQDYLATNPAQQQQMDMYTNKATQMAKGGMVKKMQTGGAVQTQPIPFSGNMVGSIPGQGPSYGPQTPKTTGTPI